MAMRGEVDWECDKAGEEPSWAALTESCAMAAAAAMDEADDGRRTGAEAEAGAAEFRDGDGWRGEWEGA